MGGAEPTLYRGAIWYTPIKEEWYYQVEVLKLEVGDQNLDLDCREVTQMTRLLQVHVPQESVERSLCFSTTRIKP